MGPDIGSHIAVYGPSGSGKTAMARRIGDQLSLPVIELDAIFHRPNWEPTPDDEFKAKVLDAMDRHSDGWVFDGNHRLVRQLILPRAETVVWLRLPFRVAYWRLLKRTFTRAWTKESLWGTNHESWRVSLLSKDSILLWGITHWGAHFRGIRRSLDEIPHRADVTELRSTRQVEAFLHSLGCHS